MPSVARLRNQMNLSAMEIVCNPTLAASTVIPGAVLPKGARPIGIQSLGGATGGTNPTVDIGGKANPAVAGLVGADDTDYFMNEQDADTPGGYVALNGVGANLVATAPIQICAGVGASAAGGGTHRSVLFYTFGPIPRGASGN